MADSVTTTKSEKETRKEASKVAKRVKTLPQLFILRGSIGAGKTTWVKGFVEGYLGKLDQVSSPSYSLINGYAHKNKRIVHVDLFRIKSAEDLESIGFWDLLDEKQVVLVEWGDFIPPEQWPKNLKMNSVFFEVIGESTRKITLS